MSKPRIVIAIVLAMLVLILIIQNTEVVTVSFLFWSFEMSRVIMILLAVMSGVICGYVIAKLTGSASETPNR